MAATSSRASAIIPNPGPRRKRRPWRLISARVNPSKAERLSRSLVQGWEETRLRSTRRLGHRGISDLHPSQDFMPGLRDRKPWTVSVSIHYSIDSTPIRAQMRCRRLRLPGLQ